MGSSNRDRFKSAAVDETSLGNILVAMGYITESQLQEAIDIQRRQAPIGEILLTMSAITLEQLEEALMVQKVNRGQASVREESQLYRRQKKRLLGEVVDCLKEATTASKDLHASLQLKHQ